MLAELWRGVRCRRLPPHLRCWQVQGGVEPAEKAEEEKEDEEALRRIGVLRLAVDNGTKTEAQTLREAMADPIVRRHLQRSGMPMPAGYDD